MEIVIKRSSRRKKTIQARIVDGRMEVLAPDYISDSALQDHIGRLRKRLLKREAERSDAHLEERAEHLNRRYFQGDLAWRSIRYSSRQQRRRGSCNVAAGTILISSRIASMPQWVEDYVIVHELAHLIEPGHGRRFKDLVRRYPLSERAIGFLIASETLCKGEKGPA
ncbi:MAG: M48 family metallopeptidase [Methanothrix sp.]|nr:M48 family metallopeptidase [Methanothrix sp.]